MALTTKLILKLRASLSKAHDLSSPSIDHALSVVQTWASGVLANQADKVWGDERTLSTGATEDLDLTGVLKDIFGDNFDLAKVKLLATNLTIGNATSPWQGPFGAATHTLVLKPSEFVILGSPALAGWPVTATSADLLKVANAAGASAKYKILIVGTSS